jgi:hypothetical protein
MATRVARKYRPGIESLEVRETPSAGLMVMHQVTPQLTRVKGSAAITGSGTIAVGGQSGSILHGLGANMQLRGNSPEEGEIGANLNVGFSGGAVSGSGVLGWEGGTAGTSGQRSVYLTGSYAPVSGVDGVIEARVGFSFLYARRRDRVASIATFVERLHVNSQNQFDSTGTFTLRGAPF